MTSPAITKPTISPPLLGDQPVIPPDTRGAIGKPPRYRGENLMKWIVPILALLTLIVIVIPELLRKWLWMRELEYAGIFWTLLSVQWGHDVRRCCYHIFVPVDQSPFGGQPRLRAGGRRYGQEGRNSQQAACPRNQWYDNLPPRPLAYSDVYRSHFRLALRAIIR